MKKYYRLLVTLSVAAVIGILGCGSGDGDEFDIARVLDLSVEKNLIAVGEGTVLAVDFTFDSEEVFNDDESIVVVVRLPEGVGYRPDTSEIDGIIDDESIGAQVQYCAGSGETFLIYDMDRFDLDDAANPSGDADARLTLTIEGIAPSNQAIIAARADRTAPIFNCGDTFISDDEVAIAIQ